MFWAGLLGPDAVVEQQDPFQTGRLESLTLEQVRELTKVLSSDRKKLNQKMESIQKEIDLNSVKLESLRLVGGDVKGTLDRLNQLSDLGQSMGHELGKVAERLKMARHREDALRKGLS